MSGSSDTIERDEAGRFASAEAARGAAALSAAARARSGRVERVLAEADLGDVVAWIKRTTGACGAVPTLVAAVAIKQLQSGQLGAAIASLKHSCHLASIEAKSGGVGREDAGDGWVWPAPDEGGPSTHRVKKDCYSGEGRSTQTPDPDFPEEFLEEDSDDEETE